MPGVSKEQIACAKEIGIEEYILSREPNNVRRIGGAYYLKDHDSLEISHGLWNWHSHGIGGKNVIDYLIKVRGYDFVGAVRYESISDAHLKALAICRRSCLDAGSSSPKSVRIFFAFCLSNVRVRLLHQSSKAVSLLLCAARTLARLSIVSSGTSIKPKLVGINSGDKTTQLSDRSVSATTLSLHISCNPISLPPLHKTSQ